MEEVFMEYAGTDENKKCLSNAELSTLVKAQLGSPEFKVRIIYYYCQLNLTPCYHVYNIFMYIDILTVMSWDGWSFLRKILKSASKLILSIWQSLYIFFIYILYIFTVFLYILGWNRILGVGLYCHYAVWDFPAWLTPPSYHTLSKIFCLHWLLCVIYRLPHPCEPQLCMPTLPHAGFAWPFPYKKSDKLSLVRFS